MDVLEKISLKEVSEADSSAIFSVYTGNTFKKVKSNLIIDLAKQKISLSQLPDDIADFTGRDSELQEIYTALERAGVAADTAVIAAISGMAGVGKSSLAIHAAHHMRAWFSDAQLYVNLQGTDAQPKDPNEVLGDWLQALGLQESEIPQTQTARVECYRAQLASKRVLVILDNAKDEAQVKPLLPRGARCAAIVTSQQTLTSLPSTREIELSTLWPEDAVVLLEKLAGAKVRADVEAAAEIVRLCGYLPLAIRLAGGLMRRKEHWQLRKNYLPKLLEEHDRLDITEQTGRGSLKGTIGEALGDLLEIGLSPEELDGMLGGELSITLDKAAKEPLTGPEYTEAAKPKLEKTYQKAIRATFNLNYQRLSPAERQLFVLLGTLPRDFGLPLATAVGEVAMMDVAAGLAQLIDAELIEVTPQQRYRYHTLLQYYAQERLGPGDQRMAEERTFRCYWECATYFKDAFAPQPVQTLTVPSQELDVERLTAESLTEEDSATEISATDGEQQNLDSSDQKQASSLEKQTPKVIQKRARPDLATAIAWFEVERNRLISVFEWGYKEGKYEDVVAFAGSLWPFFQFQGYWQDWEYTHIVALSASKESDDRKSESQTLNNLGGVYDSQGLWGEAIELYEKSLLIKQRLGDLVGENVTLTNLGSVYQAQGLWKEAESYYERSLEISRTLADDASEASLLNSLGEVAQAQEKWEEAIAHYEQSLAVKRRLGDRHGEGITLVNLGNLHRARLQPMKAAEYRKVAQTKLSAKSPEAQHVSKQLSNPFSHIAGKKLLLRYAPHLMLLVFALVNIIRGHWLLAVIGLLAVVGFEAFRILKSRS